VAEVRGAVDARRLIDAARLYVCVGRRPDLAAFGASVASAGIDLLQFRHKGVDEFGAPDVAEWREEVAAYQALSQSSALIAVNDRADLAGVVGASVLHVGQDDMPVAVARRLMGPDVALGLSTHSAAQIDAAVADADVDYFCVGPVWATPTKQGRPAVGLELVAYAASVAGSKPWFAIGGIDEQRLDEVLAAGARRVVVVRAITAAADPGAAAAAIRKRLPA
jgi:thiamine-phosphate pyrophosphorylase